MYLLLALLGMAGVGALVNSGSDADTGGGSDSDPVSTDTTEDEVVPVEDIDVTALTYDSSEEPGLDGWPIVILNDEILTPSEESDTGEPIYDLSEFDAESDRIAILEPVDHFASYNEANFDVTQTDDGDLVVSGAVLEGIDTLPRGVLEVHFVEEDFIEEGDTAFSLEDSEIVASYEIVSAQVAGEGDDSYRPGGRIELFSLTDLEGETRLAIRGDTVVRVETGDEADVINLSADTHGGEPGVSPYDGADVDANEAFVSVDSGPGNWIAEHDVSFVETNAGDDRIVMGARETVVVAGDGADTITAGATNSSYIEAGDGDDLVDLSAVEEAGLSVVQGGAGNDTFVGGAGADLYFGGTHMFGAGGDNASGGDGADSLFGSTGADVIDGGEGDDTIGGARAYVPLHDYTSGFPALDERDYADRSADTLLGGSGDDVLLGGAEDVMTGGGGEDQYGVYWTQNPEGDAGPAVVTDFEPGVEALQITVHVDDFAGLTDSPEQEITLDLVEVDGNTQVMFQGQLLVELQGVTGVSAADVSANVFVPYDRW